MSVGLALRLRHRSTRPTAGGLLPEDYATLKYALPRPGDTDVEIASDWALHWQNPLPLRVLDAALRERGRYISTHVVHEAIMNGVRHPDARALASLASTWAPHGTDPTFSISMWDDGASIVDTLRALDNHAPFDDVWLNRLFARAITVYISRADGTADEPFTVDTTTVDLETFDRQRAELQLLAAALPGVTSAPDRLSRVHIDALDSTHGRPGMGLFVLITTVTEVLGGRVDVRCDRWLLSCIRGDETNALTVTIAESPDPVPFEGNLISVRVPRQLLPTE